MKHIPYRQNPTVIDISKKSPTTAGEISTHEYELYNHINTFFNSFASVCILQTGAFCCPQKNLKKVCCLSWQNFGASVEGSRKGNTNPPPGTKGGEKMNPAQFEWQTRCEFNAYCKHTLRNELIDALRESKKRERNEVSFSALTPQEEKQLYTVDKYFANEDEETFCAGGLKITAKLLADAMHSLPDEKRRTVLLYKLVIWMLD